MRAQSVETAMALEAPFTPEHELFRRNLRAYVERELAPHALEWDEAGIFPREVFTGMAEIGALGINYPEEVGGSAGDYWYVVVLAEELVHSRNAGVNMALLVQSQMATPIINEIGTTEQKKEFLIPALAGEQKAGENRQPGERYRAALLRGLPDPRPLPARRGEPGLLPRDDELPGRAAGGGHRRGRRDAAARRRITQIRQRARRVREAADQVP